MAGGATDEDESEARDVDDRSDALPALTMRVILGLAGSPSSAGDPALVGSGSSGPITWAQRVAPQGGRRAHMNDGPRLCRLPGPRARTSTRMRCWHAVS